MLRAIRFGREDEVSPDGTCHFLVFERVRVQRRRAQLSFMGD
jgi:hypothetical protein